ncbi:unnamed protein product [Strongylus vulgaris]|uniref:Uncharacterized protein n=1 Tax=Strongylus vulgaris TaxID=40348 RepID=A0A3P7JNR0_STRVU|nr:unnamed protein product [Strongylus vulgaris]
MNTRDLVEHGIVCGEKEQDPLVMEKFSQLSITPEEELESFTGMNTRDLVEHGIVCGEKEQVDLTRSDLLVSQQRIREMPTHQQVRAQVLKSRVITTDDVVKRVDPSLTRNEIIEDLKQCARLVQGQSSFSYLSRFF